MSCCCTKPASLFKPSLVFNNSGSNDIPLCLAKSENLLPMFTKSNTDTNAAIHQREIAQIIETALAKIPENYRVVFSLREINELSVVETAYLLGISPTNVKVRLNRAKSMLRDEIEKSYSAKEMFEFNAIYCNAITTRVMNAIDEL